MPNETSSDLFTLILSKLHLIDSVHYENGIEDEYRVDDSRGVILLVRWIVLD